MSFFKYVSTKIVKKVNTGKSPCNEDNNLVPNQCGIDLIKSEAKCLLPWKKDSEQSDLEVCETKEDVQAITNIVTSERANLTGACSQSNCLEYQWTVSGGYEGLSPTLNFTTLILTLPSGSEVEIVNESIAYGLSDFAGDFGGFAGLLVGVSILSVYDDLIAILMAKFKSNRILD